DVGADGLVRLELRTNGLDVLVVVLDDLLVVDGDAGLRLEGSEGRAAFRVIDVDVVRPGGPHEGPLLRGGTGEGRVRGHGRRRGTGRARLGVPRARRQRGSGRAEEGAPSDTSRWPRSAHPA